MSGGRGLTFEELTPQVAGAAAQFRRHLEDSGRDDDRPAIAVVGANRLETLVAIWGLLEAGCPFVLLHPRWTAEERQQVLDELAVDLVIDEGWSMPAASVPPAIPPVDPERCLTVIYTSGTSGRPKGAILSRRAFVAAARASAENLGWEEEDRWLLSMPVAHVGGLSIVVRCLVARRAVVLADEGRFEPRRVAEQVERDRVSLLSVVPTMLYRLLALEPEWSPPSHLRAILLGGAAAPPALLRRAAEHGWPVYATYGLTEASSQVATQEIGTVNRGELGVGRPLPGVEVRVVQPDGAGVGSIEIRGANLFSGYVDERNPALDAEGWFRTGDLGRLDGEGRLHVVARRTDLLTSGGENVYPAEVEALLEEHPAVARACVVGLPDQEWGARVCAVLTATQQGRVPFGCLEEWLESRLAAYKRPRSVAWIDALPEDRGGKTDRRAVRRMAEQGSLMWEDTVRG